MRRIKIGLANVDTTVGAIDSNTTTAINLGREIGAAGCQLGVFQEQLFCGYPAEDLIQAADFVSEQLLALRRFAVALHDLDTVFVVGLAVHVDGFPYNACAVVYRGRVLGIVPKEDLPGYGVFDEPRVFSRGQPNSYSVIDGDIPFGDLMFKFPFGTMATYVCEETWTAYGPLYRRSAFAEIATVINSSPNRIGVLRVREQMLATRSADHECTLVATYQVGGNDSLVFDGGGFCFQNGELIGKAERFRQGVTVFEVDLARTERIRNQNSTWRTRNEKCLTEATRPRMIVVSDGPKCLEGFPSREFARRFNFLPTDPTKKAEAIDDIVETIIMGLDGYFKKSGAFEKILISLSGGKDSELTLVLAALWAVRHKGVEDQAEVIRKAAVRQLVICHSQPSRFNSDMTKSIARDSANELGAEFVEYSIESSFENEVKALVEITGKQPDALTRGNVQARIRGEREWNLSNMYKALWLQTGNMSEKAVGYSTIGADLMGGYSLIYNLPKTIVGDILVHLARKHDLKFVETLMATRASAELEENQFDEDQLMPFPVLDLAYLLYVGEMYSPADIYRIMRVRWMDAEFAEMQKDFEPTMIKAWIRKFVQRFHQSIYKWVQSPQGVHVGPLDLDRERALQIPVVNSMEYLRRSFAEMEKL